jgi:hypothetical protein
LETVKISTIKYMKAAELSIKIKGLLEGKIGTYTSINKPAIWVGVPPNGLLVDGLEVIIPRFPFEVRSRTNKNTQEKWDITLNQFKPRNGVETIVECVEILRGSLNPPPFINFIERKNTIDLKDIPIITTCVLTLEIIEVYKVGL